MSASLSIITTLDKVCQHKMVIHQYKERQDRFFDVRQAEQSPEHVDVAL